MLLADVPGEDLFVATLDQRRAMIDLLVQMQATWSQRIDRLFAIGLPDWRAPVLTKNIAAVFARTRHELDADDASVIEDFVATLDARFAKIATCGLPDTLVHGDFHSGNVRGSGTDLTVLDWGDAGIGNPLLDSPAFIVHRPRARAISRAAAPPLARCMARRRARQPTRCSVGSAGAHRRGAPSHDLSTVSGQYRIGRTSLSSRRSTPVAGARGEDRSR